MITMTILLSPFLVIFGTIFGITDRNLFSENWRSQDGKIRIEFIDGREAVVSVELDDENFDDIELNGKFSRPSLRHLALRNGVFKANIDSAQILWRYGDYESFRADFAFRYDRKSRVLEVRPRVLSLKTEAVSRHIKFRKNKRNREPFFDPLIFVRCEK